MLVAPNSLHPLLPPSSLLPPLRLSLHRIMNLFFLHPNPRKCARWHCNKHVVKMLLESCQLLYTAHWVFAAQAGLDTPDLTDAPMTVSSKQAGYKPTHRNHPCGRWVRASLSHYLWLCQLAAELVREYRFRYGATKVHACEAHVVWLTSHTPAGLLDNGWSSPPSAMPEAFRISANTVRNYRHFYATAKEQRGFLVYMGRQRPHWLPAIATTS